MILKKRETLGGNKYS